MKIVINILILSILLFDLLQGQPCNYAINNEIPPESEPIIYGKGIISKDSLILYGISFTPDGQELIYSVKSEGVYYMNNKNGKWTNPELMEFSKHSLTHIMYPMFSPDGNTISYVDGNSKQYGWGDIFMIKRQVDGKWSQSIKLPEPINSTHRDAGHCFTLDGKLYLTSGRVDCAGNCDIFRACPQQNGEIKIDFLSDISQFGIITDEENLYVSPKEEFLITDSWHQHSSHKRDLYITYRLDNDKWSPIKPLNSKINTDSFETEPFVTSDGKHLFFIRWMNEKRNVYWVSTKEVFVPYQRLQIPDFYTKANADMLISFSKNIFADYNGKIVDYEVFLRNTNSLLNWINFDKEKMELTGKPSKTETLDLVLRAIDNDKNAGEIEFKIIIEK